MLFKLIRDLKIALNHKKRVNSIVLKSNDEIVRKMDSMKTKYLECERKGDKEQTVYYQAIYNTLNWLISADE